MTTPLRLTLFRGRATRSSTALVSWAARPPSSPPSLSGEFTSAPQMKDRAVGLGDFSEVGSLMYGVLIPLYMSIKSVQSEKTFDDKQWLSYWVIFGVLTILETAFKFLAYVVPLYYELKWGLLAFLV